MSLEKPWAKPYDALLTEMVNWWRGEILEVEGSDNKSSFRIVEPSFFMYRRFRAKVDSRELIVEISEAPLGDALIFDGADNVEFLRLRIRHQTGYHLLVRHERFTDKLLKMVGLEHEFQTGDAEFDRRYFLATRKREDEALLRNSEFRRAVCKLEPFATIKISPYEVSLSQEIGDKSQLELPAVKDCVERLMKFVDLVPKKR